MVEEAKRTLAYFCPACRRPVVVERSVFQLAAAPSEIPCPCGKSALRVELLGDHARLTVPCLFCAKDHTVRCSARAFLREKAIAFACGISGLDCCYVGEEDAVFAAVARLEQAVDKLEEQAGAEGEFLDSFVMQEVLTELRDIVLRDGVSCACGSKHWDLRVNYSSIDLICAACGSAMRIPAATARDIDDICCKQTLLIRGKK